MKSRTRLKLVPIVLCAVGLVVLVLAGCRREEPASAAPSGARLSARAKAFCARDEIAARMHALLDAALDRAGGDAAKARAALAADPEWQELERRFKASEEEVAKVRGGAGGKISK